MRIVVAVFMSLFLVSCSDHHAGLYVYNSKAYTSTKVSDFEVSHFKEHGSSHFIVVNDSESKGDIERSSKITALCEEYALNCKTIDYTEVNGDLVQKVVDVYRSIKGRKFFVFSPNKLVTAQFVGTIDLMEHSGDDRSLKRIFSDLGIKDQDGLQSQLLSLKK
ncbi:MAG: hypothetical protein CL677_09070 [Bdellovibrionaceae bacterium]|nr:hypothetical protein [Pseudobdellovibrionaceae bacterium]|tara:strand:+ start:69691 stop:70179 length:489 start_codon:yes stop_codon:yes gene_type:complete